MQNAKEIVGRLEPPDRTLVLLVGVAGVGKTEFAKEILKRMRLAYIEKDSLSDSFSASSRTQPEYTDHRKQVYISLWRLAEDNLSNGNSVLVDAPLAKEMSDPKTCELIRNLLNKTCARLCVIRLACSEFELHTRLVHRGLSRDADKLGAWDSWKEEEPIWFHIPFEHIDISSDERNAANVEMALRYVLNTPTEPASREDQRWERSKVLWQGAIESFNQRRRYEWQMCLAMWGSMVGALTIVVTREAQVGPIGIWGFPALGLAITIVLTYWIRNVQHRNNQDREIADPYWNELRRLAPNVLSTTLLARIRESQGKRSSSTLDWNHKSQIIITWLLCSALVLVSLAITLKA